MIDGFIQKMQYGQTNGIPEVNEVSNFLAEMLLAYIDNELSLKIITMIIIYCDTEMIIEYLLMINVLLMKF